MVGDSAGWWDMRYPRRLSVSVLGPESSVLSGRSVWLSAFRRGLEGVKAAGVQLV